MWGFIHCWAGVQLSTARLPSMCEALGLKPSTAEGKMDRTIAAYLPQKNAPFVMGGFPTCPVFKGASVFLTGDLLCIRTCPAWLLYNLAYVFHDHEQKEEVAPVWSLGVTCRRPQQGCHGAAL